MHSSIDQADFSTIYKLNVIVALTPALSSVYTSNSYFRLNLTVDMVTPALEKVGTVRGVMAYLLEV